MTDAKRRRVFSITNNKGGVTKTVTTLQLAYYLSRIGRKSLVIDTDPQCNTTYTLLGDKVVDPLKTIFGAVIGTTEGGKVPIEEIIIPTPNNPNLFLVPGHELFTAADVMLASQIGREKILKRLVDRIVDDYDFILMDTGPNMTLSTIMAIVAAKDGLIVPETPQIYSVLGTDNLDTTLTQLRENLDMPIPIFGVLIAKVQRTKNANDRIDQLEGFFNENMFVTRIPINERIEESLDTRESIYEYDPTSTGAEAYERFGNEFLEREKDWDPHTWNPKTVGYRVTEGAKE